MEGNYDGYIFDCDGTLIDSMPVHFHAWDEALRRLGNQTALSEDLFYSHGGVPTRRVAEIFIQQFGLKADPEELFHLKESLFVAKLEQVQTIAPVVDFARKVARTHPVSVASGGPREVVVRSLQLAGLAGLFPIVVTAEDVVHGKPAPDMFLLAAQRMGVAPAKCLVFEDAEPGVQAARNAGMQVVRVESRLGSFALTRL
ncbi:MAG TPA: HAD family phosphatase [Myxococcales bacterium]|nr:HAD family phosphatase [Myxococcales bacterium]